MPGECYILSDTYKCYYREVYQYIYTPTCYVLITVNLIDAQIDAHIVRIENGSNIHIYLM